MTPTPRQGPETSSAVSSGDVDDARASAERPCDGMSIALLCSRSRRRRLGVVVSLLALVLSACATADHAGPTVTAVTESRAVADPSLPALGIEEVGRVEMLPEHFPDSWFWVFDPAFAHMLDGKVILVDAAAESVREQIQGTFNISLMGMFLAARTRPEIYAIESFAPRGTRGARTDVLTVHDRRSLAPLGEIVWPRAKRFMGLPHRNSMALIDDEHLLLVLNFNPATSVTVIDTARRRIVNEVEVPGCSMIYPTGARGFSSLCANGSILTLILDPAGQVISRRRAEPFFDSERAPVLDRPAVVDRVAHFLGYEGEVRPVDFSQDAPRVLPTWSLVTDSERAEGWRPGGLTPVAWDDAGRAYVLMHPQGFDGSHSSPGSELWVFDLRARKRLRRIALTQGGLSVGVGTGPDPLLLVTNPEMNLDVYRAATGQLQRTLRGLGQETPLFVAGAGQ